MKQQKLLKTYSLLKNKLEYPENADKILKYMYASNRKFFTHHELTALLKTDIEETRRAIEFLLNHGEIDYKSIDSSENDYFFFLDVRGAVENLKQTVSMHQAFTDVLETALENEERNDEELTNFMKASILFNCEVTDFINRRISEYFPLNDLNNEKVSY